MAQTKKSSSKSESLQKILIENFVTFQKVMINLSAKFEELSKKISELLELFEITAKTMAERDINPARSDETKELIEKMNIMLDQNKVIARGLTLMHESMSGSSGSYEETKVPETVQPQPSPMPKMIPKKPEGKILGMKRNLADYQRSLSTRNPMSDYSIRENSKFKQLPKKENG
jgi:hypothetical protein